MNEKKELTLKEKQAIILDMMKDVDRFCRANDIPYTICGGTMLGAIRHGGFIPWDDDADLFMLREDFDRFVSTYRSEKYHLLFNTRKDDEFFTLGFAKVCDPTTSAIECRHSSSKYGVYLDIFALDHVPTYPKECDKFMHKVISVHNRLYHRQKKDIVSIIKSYRHSLDWWWDKLHNMVRDGRYADSPLVSHIIGTSNDRTIVPKIWFETLVDIPFEGHKFLGFREQHSYLKMLYGPNYMTPKKWSHNYKAWKK
jgi:hypothetical protein